MLILSRKVDQEIYIYPGDGLDPNMTVAELFSQGPIRVKLVEVRHSRDARLGIAAPDSLCVLRAELAR